MHFRVVPVSVFAYVAFAFGHVFVMSTQTQTQTLTETQTQRPITQTANVAHFTDNPPNNNESQSEPDNRPQQTERRQRRREQFAWKRQPQRDNPDPNPIPTEGTTSTSSTPPGNQDHEPSPINPNSHIPQTVPPRTGPPIGTQSERVWTQQQRPPQTTCHIDPLQQNDAWQQYRDTNPKPSSTQVTRQQQPFEQTDWTGSENPFHGTFHTNMYEKHESMLQRAMQQHEQQPNGYSELSQREYPQQQYGRQHQQHYEQQQQMT